MTLSDSPSPWTTWHYEGRHFRLFANCVATRGPLRALISDLQRGDLHLVPNGMLDVLEDLERNGVETVMSSYGPGDVKTIEAYVDFLERNQLAAWLATPDAFPALGGEWKHPGAVSNAIIDFDTRSTHDLSELVHELDALGCNALQIRVFEWPDGTHDVRRWCAEVVGSTRSSRLRYVEIVAPYAPELDDAWIAGVAMEQPRLLRVVLHGAPSARDTLLRPLQTAVCWVPEHFAGHRCCGQVSPDHFVANVQLYAEGMGCNTCLNKKVSVGADGLIRNCPSLMSTYGKAGSMPLAKAISAPGFDAMWSITKDQVEVCKDCEFRKVCTDCRAFVADSESAYSKPAKCAYDPYTATWADPTGP